jgi:hypothetical protein
MSPISKTANFSSGSSPCPSLDELLEGFTDNKVLIASFSPNVPDSDDEDDEGDLDEWEDDSEMELEYADRVVGGK